MLLRDEKKKTDYNIILELENIVIEHNVTENINMHSSIYLVSTAPYTSATGRGHIHMSMQA